MYRAKTTHGPGRVRVSTIPDSKPWFIIPTAAVLLLAFGIGPNVDMAVLACGVLIAGTFLLWRPGEVQTLLLVFVLQWLQPTVLLFYANLRGVRIAELMHGYPGVETATALMLLGLFFLAVGLRLGSGGPNTALVAQFSEALGRVSQKSWLYLHLMMLVLSAVATFLAMAAPPLSQPLLALANFRWATYVGFTISTFASRDHSRAIWVAVFCFEFVLDLGGYFSSFKHVFLYTLLSFTPFLTRLNARTAVVAVLVAAAMLSSALYWTAIKPDYRYYVSGGSNQQQVVVAQKEALLKIVELVSDVTARDLLSAANELTHRFSEVDVFSLVVVNVPSVVRHESGGVWLDAISRPFMPRVLFPGKSAIDESERTIYYTGRQFAGLEKGTQVGLGYIADSYIDFGRFGMMGALLALGAFIGGIYRWLMRQRSGNVLVNSALTTAIFMQVASVGVSSPKLAGGVLVSLLVAYLLLKFVVPRLLPWLAGDKQRYA